MMGICSGQVDGVLQSQPITREVGASPSPREENTAIQQSMAKGSNTPTRTTEIVQQGCPFGGTDIVSGGKQSRSRRRREKAYHPRGSRTVQEGQLQSGVNRILVRAEGGDRREGLRESHADLRGLDSCSSITETMFSQRSGD